MRFWMLEANENLASIPVGNPSIYDFLRWLEVVAKVQGNKKETNQCLNALKMIWDTLCKLLDNQQKFSGLIAFDDHSAENCVRRPFALLLRLLLWLLFLKKLMKILLCRIITHCAPYGIKMSSRRRWLIFQGKLHLAFLQDYYITHGSPQWAILVYYWYNLVFVP